MRAVRMIIEAIERGRNPTGYNDEPYSRELWLTRLSELVEIEDAKTQPALNFEWQRTFDEARELLKRHVR